MVGLPKGSKKLFYPVISAAVAALESKYDLLGKVPVIGGSAIGQIALAGAVILLGYKILPGGLALSSAIGTGLMIPSVVALV